MPPHLGGAHKKTKNDGVDIISVASVLACLLSCVNSKIYKRAKQIAFLIRG